MRRGRMEFKRTFSMNRGQVSIFKKGDEVGFCSFLKCHDGGGLETKIRLEEKKWWWGQ